jgi:general transcription factor IIIA
MQLVHNESKERDQKCEKCNAAFYTAQHLKRHLKLHDNPKPFVCTYEGCNEAFSKHNQLLLHISKSHTNELPYKCTFVSEDGTECDRRFEYPSQLKKHCRTSHQQNRFLCAYEGL